jgi:hypothetical protein
MTAINIAQPSASSAMAQPATSQSRIIALHALVGAVLGYLILRLLALAVFWFEFRETSPHESFLEFVLDVSQRINLPMFSLSLIMLLLGSSIGLLSGLYTVSLLKREAKLLLASQELGSDVEKLIGNGENERIEFKSSMRWDLKEQKINKTLEGVIIKTIAGFLNHQGGNLLIGVDDTGQVLGLEQDYQTLKHPDRDGFAQLLTTLIRNSMGGDICPLIYPVFHAIDGKDVCRVVIPAGPRPIFVKQNNNPEFYLRTGNATAALNVQEAVIYINRRWPNSRA